MIIKINGTSYKTQVSKNKVFSGTSLEGWLLAAQHYNDKAIVDSLIKAQFIMEIK
jgi:hypothetical protein